MSLPNDVARCPGATEERPAGGAVWWKWPCIYCLRRTAPLQGSRFYSFMQPPDFTTTCPYRIAPHD